MVETVVEDGQHRLQTLEYRYRLQNKPGFKESAVLRWEYGRQPTPSDSYNRHHSHVAASVKIGSSAVSLENVHLPTGWVTVEEVIRFVIYELGVKPPCGDQWPNVLAASEKKLYELFTSKRYVPPKSKS